MAQARSLVWRRTLPIPDDWPVMPRFTNQPLALSPMPPSRPACTSTAPSAAVAPRWECPGGAARKLGRESLAEQRCTRIADTRPHRVRVVLRGSGRRRGALRLRLRRVAGPFALQASLHARPSPTDSPSAFPFAEEETSLYARAATFR